MIKKLFKCLNETYPAVNKNHHITYDRDTDALILGVWTSGTKISNFTLDDSDLANPEKTLEEIARLLEVAV